MKYQNHPLHTVTEVNNTLSIRCPKCHGPLENVPVHDLTASGELDSPAIHPDRDEYEEGNPANIRGEYTRVPMFCWACETSYDLTTGNHKGDQILAFSERIS